MLFQGVYKPLLVIGIYSRMVILSYIIWGRKDMDRTPLIRKSLVVGIILLFIAGIFIPCSQSSRKQLQKNSLSTNEQKDLSTVNAKITCYTFGRTGNGKQNVVLSFDEATLIFERLQELKTEMTSHPYSMETQLLKTAFVDLLDEKGFFPETISEETVRSSLNPNWVQRVYDSQKQSSSPQLLQNRGTTMLCSIAGEGSGLIYPFFLLPRPRIVMFWLGDGTSFATNLLTSRGYVAEGTQTGFTLGFMGIGLSFALPGATLYGFIGYALLAHTKAEYIEHFPPNNAPEISAVQPIDGQENVSLALTELQFSLQDADGDLMSYSVTTSPDVGGGNGNIKPNGVYSVPISGLKSSTQYTWYVSVTDGKDSVEEKFMFSTEQIAPIISEVEPVNGNWYVPITQSYLRFYLRDPQNDLMSYTVETSPDIGSASGSGVGEGYVYVPINGLEFTTTYQWFVNVTDGINPTAETFMFRTEPRMIFDPFEEGWQYRKMMTINHNLVSGTLTNFPVLISITDGDLRDKAQDDGDDILFMNGEGVATRLYHELELFNGISGQMIAWVNITVLSSIVDTSLWMYYGNSDCDNQETPSKVWDSKYEAVYHMNDETTLTLIDSTANNHDLIKYANNAPIESPNGKVGNCQSFDGSHDWMTTSTWFTGSELSVSVWVKAEHDFSDNYYRIYEIEDEPSAHDYPAHALSVSDFWQPTFGCDLSTCPNQYIRYSDCVISQNSWYHLGVTRATASRAKLYINGIKATGTISERSNNWAGAIEYNNGGNFKIGVFKQGSTMPYGASWWGKMDEFRLSSCSRNESWMSTEYNSMMYPGSFVNVGPEEPHP